MKQIILTLLLVIIFPSTVLAWDDCLYGKVNDTYPGDCSRYIDTDNDGICDHSQPAPADRGGDNSNIEGDTDNLIARQDIKTDVSKKESNSTYHLLPLSLLLVVLFVFSHILSKKGIISIVKHRQIWNILLLISFFISGLLGILLIIRINFGLIIPLPFNMLFWHVEVGIILFLITIFHLSWHLPYFKNIFKVKKSDN